MQTFAKYINQIRLLQQRCLKQKENRRAMLLGEGLSAVRAQLEKVDEQMAGLAEGSPEEIAALWASAGGPACKAAKEEIELATSMLPWEGVTELPVRHRLFGDEFRGWTSKGSMSKVTTRKQFVLVGLTLFRRRLLSAV
jgi:hypothetical protein